MLTVIKFFFSFQNWLSSAKLLNSRQQNITTALHLFQICPFDNGMGSCSSGAEHNCWNARRCKQGSIHPCGLTYNLWGRTKEQCDLARDRLHDERLFSN